MNEVIKKTCAYCNSNSKLTREHIIPKWYLELHDIKKDKLYGENIPQKFIASDLFIKDVCTDCNSGVLSTLDKYAQNLYFSYLSKYADLFDDNKIEYDYDLLMRFLLKVSFNSSRANKSDYEILHLYRDYIMGKKRRPRNILLFCELLTPYSYSETPENIESNIQFRVSVFRIPNLEFHEWCFRAVAIDNYIFYVVVSDISSQKNLSKQKKVIFEYMKNSDSFGVALSVMGKSNLNKPMYSSKDMLVSHIANNPMTYKVDSHSWIDLDEEKKFDIYTYVIDRKDIEEDNTNITLDFLNHLISSREHALRYMGKFEIMVHGYDDDSRELHQIPEVVAYLKKIDDNYPYWLFIQHQDGLWLKVLMHCLSKDPSLKELVILKDDFFLIMQRWFTELNSLCNSLAIDIPKNRKLSKNFINILKKTSYKNENDE